MWIETINLKSYIDLRPSATIYAQFSLPIFVFFFSNLNIFGAELDGGAVEDIGWTDHMAHRNAFSSAASGKRNGAKVNLRISFEAKLQIPMDSATKMIVEFFVGCVSLKPKFTQKNKRRRTQPIHRVGNEQPRKQNWNEKKNRIKFAVVVHSHARSEQVCTCFFFHFSFWRNESPIPAAFAHTHTSLNTQAHSGCVSRPLAG